MESQRKFVIGIVRSSHGLTGKFKVESTSGECEHFFKLTEVTLRNGSTEKNYKVQSVEGTVNSLLMKLDGINSPEETKKIQGFEILVPRDKACPLNEGEFYIEDLKNCNLVYYTKSDKRGLAEKSESAIIAGTITDVLEGGTGKLLEVELSESLKTSIDDTDKESAETEKKQKTVLVPFNKEFIGAVDIKNKVVQLMHLWILE